MYYLVVSCKYFTFISRQTQTKLTFTENWFENLLSEQRKINKPISSVSCNTNFFRKNERICKFYEHSIGFIFKTAKNKKQLQFPSHLLLFLFIFIFWATPNSPRQPNNPTWINFSSIFSATKGSFRTKSFKKKNLYLVQGFE